MFPGQQPLPRTIGRERQNRARRPTTSGSVQRALLSLIVSSPVPSRPSTSDIPDTHRTPSWPKNPKRSVACHSTPAFAPNRERRRPVVEISGISCVVDRRRRQYHVGLVHEREAERGFGIGLKRLIDRLRVSAQADVQPEAPLDTHRQQQVTRPRAAGSCALDKSRFPESIEPSLCAIRVNERQQSDACNGICAEGAHLSSLENALCHCLALDADTGRRTGPSLATSKTTVVVRDGQHNGSLAA